MSSITMLDTVLAPRPDDTPGDVLGCLLAAGVDPSGGNLDNLVLGFRHATALETCMSGVPTVGNVKGLVATFFLLAAAAVVYAWLPRWRDRKNRTVPVGTVSGDTSLQDELAQLRELSGTAPGVRFRVDPTRTTAGAVVYGSAGRYTVCLHAGLVARRGTDPDGFRTVVLHELAHIRNRDVDFAYGSTALWRVFVVLALLPYLFQQGRLLTNGLLGRDTSPFWPGAVSIITYSLLSGLLLVALVHLARADLLRRRELHADIQAVAWGARLGGWDHPDPPGTAATPLRRVIALLRTHPQWAERRRVLDDPGRMARVSALEMLLTGVGASLLVHEVLVVPGLSGGTGGAFLTALLVAPVLFLVLRRSVASAAQSAGRRTDTGVRAGLWLGAGLVVGTFVGGGNSGTEWVIAQPVYLLALVVTAVVPAVWTAQFCRLTLVLPGRLLRIATVLLNFLVTLALLWGGLHWWQSSGRALAMGVAVHDGALTALIKEEFPGPWGLYPRDLSVISAVSPVLMMLNKEVLLAAAALLMSLVPLLLHVRVRGTGLRLRRTLMAGLAGGLVCWAGLAAAAYALRARRPVTFDQRAGAFQYVHMWWQIAALTGACLVTASVVAGVSRRHWLLRALLAAQVVQFMAYAAVFALAAADGCLGPLNKLGDRCHWLPENGRILAELTAAQSLTAIVFLSACAALAGAAVGRIAHRHRPTASPSQPSAQASPEIRPWPAVLRRSTILVLGVPACLLTVLTHADDADSAQRSAVENQRFAELFDTPQTARVAKVREWQAAAWLGKGGLDRIGGMGDAFTALGDALTEAAEQKPDTNGKIRLDETKFSRLCGTLGGRAAQARKYFPVPFKELQQPWSDALRRLQSDSRTCQDAMAMGEDAKFATNAERSLRFQQSLDGMSAAMDALTDVLQKLDAMAFPSKDGT
ncbi:M48 family metalloprotease [Streptomyces scopuliridis]|uniref:M48 family metalloprotease n=1 Tax=Streptomyces scopuliridis TaxID=452529 RepID=UPI0036C14E25